MDKQLLVLGGGVAGLSASLSAAQSGAAVALIEKDGRLGGFASQFCCKATDSCAYCSACIADEILREVRGNSLVEVGLNSTLNSVEKSDSGFKAKLSSGEEVSASAIIIATGFEPFDSATCRSATALASHPDIVSGIEIERMLRDNGRIIRPSNNASPKSVAFIQCVGSRSRKFGSEECSRVCCPYAIRIARRIKWQEPDCEIAVFHMDLQGIRKVAVDMYSQFVGEIDFIRGIPAEAVKGPEGQVVLKYEKTPNGEIDRRAFELVVLSVGMLPGYDTEDIAGVFGLQLGPGGFLKPTSELRHHLSGVEGVFFAGSCSGPKDIRDSIAQGRAAAQAALNWIQGKDN